MTVHYTYVLKSEKDSNFYVGCTKDLKLRFEEHQSGKVESTKGRRPFEIIYFEGCNSKEDALDEKNI